MVTTQSRCNKNALKDFLIITSDVGIGICEHDKMVVSYDYSKRVHLSKSEEDALFRLIMKRREEKYGGNDNE